MSPAGDDARGALCVGGQSLHAVAPVCPCMGYDEQAGVAATIRAVTPRWPLVLRAFGLAATSFAFLLIGEHRPLFGFQEPGYDPAGIAAARVSEIAAVVLLGAFLIARLRRSP
jgi:hypothetical protein